MDTLDSNFYSAAHGVLVKYSATFSVQVNMPKISALTFEQRHVFDSDPLYKNQHDDDLLGKQLITSPFFPSLTFHNYSQWIMRLLGILRHLEDRLTEFNIYLKQMPITSAALKMFYSAVIVSIFI